MNAATIRVKGNIQREKHTAIFKNSLVKSRDTRSIATRANDFNAGFPCSPGLPLIVRHQA